MLAAQRQHLILQELEAAGTVRVAALAELLDVSEMTVRRDIDALDAGGLLLRVHGGAARTDSFSALEPAFASKSTRELAAKAAIAAEAVRLIEPGMTLLISGGTTTFELARILPGNMGLTVATNSLMVANSLASGVEEDGSDIRTLILGGERTPSEALVGPLAAQAVRTLEADLCFMGVHGMDPQAGITSPNLLEAELNAAMISASRKLIVLADATKYGLVGLAGISPLSAIHTLITDVRITEAAGDALAALHQAVGDIRIAGLEPGPDGPAAGALIPPPGAEHLSPPASKGQ
ncbi:DeoR/GlpR transcriptional regulator [Arthrobacter sp. CDRTa11]|uniref:DeoR/GlpR family DNA-binding transcription regulator n=1 Tax=Arthrobacter sp. CDRTa11 TaxID=2651199 RepID=UPI002265B445|nr:DeoR/GlpR family DNA-binding transcription regulator [Arthrobacter sp. CDRTa11]UZX02344.1 DeoR/GlpR transcriptional regulator [Arthrobacter sp. CDRTa11]